MGEWIAGEGRGGQGSGQGDGGDSGKADTLQARMDSNQSIAVDLPKQQQLQATCPLTLLKRESIYPLNFAKDFRRIKAGQSRQPALEHDCQ